MFFLFWIFSFFLGIISGENNTTITTIFCVSIIFVLTIISFEKIFLKMFTFLWIFLLSFWITVEWQQKRLQSLEKIQEITNNFSQKISITGKIDKKMYQNDFRKTYKLYIDTVDTTSTRYIFDSHKKIAIFVDIPVNLTLNTNDIISFEWKLKNIYNSDTLSGFEKYWWFHNTYGNISLYSFKRISEWEKNFFPKNTRIRERNYF